MLDKAVAYWRRTIGAVRLHRVDHAVAYLLEKARLPVILKTRRIEAVDQLLRGGVRHRTNLVHQLGDESLQRFHDTLPLLDWPVVADRKPNDRRPVGQRDENHPGGQLIGGVAR